MARNRCRLLTGQSDRSHSLMPWGGVWVVLQGFREEVQSVT